MLNRIISRLQLRRDTAADWTAENPILADGEPGYDSTNNLLKIGDGTTAWSSLPVAIPTITPISSGQVPKWSGSKFVGVTPDTALDELDATYSAFDDGGAEADGVTDDTAALLSVHAAGRPIILRPQGVYRVDTASFLNLTSDLRIIGDGTQTIVRDSDTPLLFRSAWGTPVDVDTIEETDHTFPGSAANTPAIRVDIGASHSFAIGDLVRLLADDVLPGGTTGTSAQRTAQFGTIGDVDGNVVYISGLLNDPMTTDVRIVKVPRFSVHLEGFSVTDEGGASSGFTTSAVLLDGLVNPEVNIDVHDVGAKAIEFYGCRDIKVDSNVYDGNNTDGSYSAYGITARSCEGGTVRVHGRRFRHLFTTLTPNVIAGTTLLTSVGRTRDLTVSGRASDCYNAAWDTHPCADGITFLGAHVDGARTGQNASDSIGHQYRGRNISGIGCKVRGVGIGWRSLNSQTGDSKNHSVTGCEALNCEWGLYVRDEVYGELTFEWHGGRLQARSYPVRAENSERTLIVDAVAEILGEDGIAYFATGNDHPAPIEVQGGMVIAHSGGDSIVAAGANAASAVTVYDTKLVGTFAELLDSSRSGTLKFGGLNTDEATITTLGGSTSVKAFGIRRPLFYIKTWDPSSMPAGSYTSTTATVTGAKIGDLVLVGMGVALPAGVIVAGAVTADDTVTLTLANHTAGAVDLGSGTANIAVYPAKR